MKEMAYQRFYCVLFSDKTGHDNNRPTGPILFFKDLYRTLLEGLYNFTINIA